MPERRDFLPVCNDHGVPLPDFQAMFCSRCVQAECSRSRGGGLFETRVATWEDRLFVNPPRLEKSDPLYAALSAKRFIDVDIGRIPEVGGRSDWVDPRALEEPAPVASPRPRPARPVSRPMVEEAPHANEAAPAESPRAVVSGGPLNTPFTQPVMLGAPSQTGPTRPVDRWATPPVAPAAEPDAPIVRAGARIKLGG